MRLSDTWKTDFFGHKACVWCYRDAQECYLDRCNGRRQWEREYRPNEADV